MKYFRATAKCGHVGKNNCVWIDFAVCAESAKEGAEKVRDYKRVKHQHKDYLKEIKEITFEEFMILKSQNDSDPYLHCKNIQEQNKIENFEDRISIDELNLSKHNIKTSKKESKDYRYKKNKIQSKQKFTDMFDFFLEDGYYEINA